jgi:O-antigen/teichoic acid export membrane protein
VAKIVLLVLLATALPFYGVFASWTIALAASVLLTNALLFTRLIPRRATQARPADQDLTVGKIARYVAPDYVGSIFWLASTTLLPILVAQKAGLRATAFFYLAWQIGYGLHSISINMGYSLVVEGASDPQSLAAYSRRVTFLIMRIVVPAAVLLALGAPFIMGVFGPDYAREGSTLLSLLALSAIPFSVVSLYISVARVQRRVRRAALVLGLMCCLVLGLSEVLLPVMGLKGVGVAWLLTQTVVGAMVFVWQLWPLWAVGGKALPISAIRIPHGTGASQG